MSTSIKEILTKPVLNEADRKALEDFEPNDGTNRLYSFFTPVWLCEVMYQLAVLCGFNTLGKL